MTTLGRRPAVRAFTLLELVAVLLVLAIVGAMAAPRFAEASGRQRVDAAARRIAADLALARRQARTAGAAQSVTFTPALNDYELAALQSLENSKDPYIVELDRAPYDATLYSADFGGKVEVTFDGYGVPDSGGTVEVRVGPFSRTVTLDIDSGEASIE
jgi:prepilin-type N-terminal cleavage/methylation domain-containing protein